MTSRRRGSMTLQMAVLLVPVMFGLMGFGLDLGRLYLVRGELNQAAEAMALAAAEQLIGTNNSLAGATTAANLVLNNASGHGNKYNFGSLTIGESTGFLSSVVEPPAYFETVAGAVGDPTTVTGDAPGTTARHVRIDVSAESPLVFWSVLSLGRDRKTNVAARAVAGVSAPLCTACGIEPFAIAAISPDDTTDFGLVPGNRYTLGYQCNGQPVPGPLPNTTQRLPYLIVNRYNDAIPIEESQQLFRVGAQGLLPSTTQAQSCVLINGSETGWVTAAPNACQQNTVTPSVTAALCGISARFTTDTNTACQIVADVANLVSSYTQDDDLTDLDDYTAYEGNGRRIITVPVVDALIFTGPMLVLGFRQFLIEPNAGDTTVNPTDANGRFPALYIGSVAPVRQGSFAGCSIAAGPGKVVLHR